MTPRWLPVLAAATPLDWQDKVKIHDLAVDSLSFEQIEKGDLVCISLHTLNACRAYQLMKTIQRKCGAKVLLGGVHVTIRPEEALSQGADCIVKGEGEEIWPKVIEDFAQGRLQSCYEGSRIAESNFIRIPRWDLLSHEKYMIATVQTTRGCPESCTFCSVWRSDGRTVRFRSIQDTVDEINYLYEIGFRIIALADDNFYSVGSNNRNQSDAIIEQRMKLMKDLEEKTPSDIKYLTQTTIRTSDDKRFMVAMKRAKIKGVLIGIEAIDPVALRSIGKRFNKQQNELLVAIKRLQENGIYVLGSFIVGLGTDSNETYPEMLKAALNSNMALAQFVQYTCFPGTVDYDLIFKGKHKLSFKSGHEEYWLSNDLGRTHVVHPTLNESDIQEAIESLWSNFYSTRNILNRGWYLGLRKLKWIFVYWAFCKFYKNVYSQYGLSADSARTARVGYLTKFFGAKLVRVLKSDD